MAYTNADIQQKLKDLKFYAGDVDGLAGKLTAEAVVAFQKSKGLPETGKVDPVTLAALFPSAVSRPKTIVATFRDYLLNYAQSKIVWAAGVLVAAIVAWVQTKFGFSVPPDVVNWVTTGLVTVGGLLIAVLRGQGKDTPRIADVQPAVVKQPDVTVGVEKK